jgi:hypothetical protein
MNHPPAYSLPSLPPITTASSITPKWNIKSIDIPLSTPVPIPEWLHPTPPPIPANLQLTKLKNEIMETQFDSSFERVLDQLAEGKSLKTIFEDDPREFKESKFIKWVLKDPTRKEAYHEALEIGAEMIAAEMIEISDGTDSMEDVQRSTLRINTRKWLLGIWNKKRYGEIKQIEMNGVISITNALKEARERVTIDASYKELDDAETDI